jgi:hypothetical protein
MKPSVSLFLFSLALLAVGGATNSTVEPTTRLPSAATTVIVANERYWSISEISAKATRVLTEKAGMPPGLDCEVLVNVYVGGKKVDGKRTICELSYLQGFNRPAWIAYIGYDGEVVSFFATKVIEGKPKL